jgi:hypothetical protein
VRRARISGLRILHEVAVITVAHDVRLFDARAARFGAELVALAPAIPAGAGMVTKAVRLVGGIAAGRALLAQVAV